MPEGADSAYIQNITDMRESFARLDEALEQVQGLTASGSGLDAISGQGRFFCPLFWRSGSAAHSGGGGGLCDCFLRYETTTEVQWMRTSAPSLWKLSQRPPCRSPALTTRWRRPDIS